LNQETAFLSTGVESDATLQLTATVSPAGAANKTVTWISSNPAVATVNDNGLVTRVGDGTTNIVAITEDGSFTDTCIVTVDWLGQVSFVTNRTWTVTSTDGTYNQIWSDVVQATGTDKATFNGNLTTGDGRNQTGERRGHLFSGHAVVAMPERFCPAPWRLPIRSDVFRNDGIMALNEVFGGTPNGGTGTMTETQVWDTYFNDAVWGGSWTGQCGPTAAITDIPGNGIPRANYWTSEIPSGTNLHGIRIGINVGSVTVGGTGMSGSNRNLGFAIRCVKDN
jgi:hypothetical protein